MTDGPKHLDAEQIERLVAISFRDVDGPAKSPPSEDAVRHLRECDACRRRISSETAAELTIRSLKRGDGSVGSDDCPTEQTLYEFAAGQIEHAKTQTLITHVVSCDHCAPTFRKASEILLNDVTAEEREFINALQTANPSWQRNFAGTLSHEIAASSAAAGTKSFGKLFYWQKLIGEPWAYAAILLLLLLGGGWVIAGRRSSPSYVQTLLIEAYSRNRTVELRIPNVRHTPLSVTRGSPSSNIDKPTPLLDAEAIIAKHLVRNRSDIRWLQQKAEAELLDGSPDASITTAEEALRLDPQFLPLWGDLGAAYFVRGENTGHAADYARAYEWTSKVLAKQPNDPATLFNRAVIAERLFLYREAAQDFAKCIEVETDPGWRAEAQEKLAKVKEHLSEAKPSINSSLDPEKGLIVRAEGQEVVAPAEANGTVEDLQAKAIRHWLPEVFSQEILDRNLRDRRLTTLNRLADDLRGNHQDRWLADLLSNSRSESPGFRMLADATAENEAGNHASAIKRAVAAQHQFQLDNNNAGRLRAGLEEAYGDRFQAMGDKCYNKAVTLISEVDPYSYAWIRIQAGLEAAACAAEVSRIDESIRFATEARRMAHVHHYRNLELRAVTFLAGLTEDPVQALQYLLEGLNLYWTGRFEPMRGYSLYAVADTVADAMGLRFFDLALIEEALSLVHDDRDLALRGIETYRLARAHVMLENEPEALKCLALARKLIEGSPSNELEADGSVYLAEAYIERGRYERALDLLQTAESTLNEIHHDILSARFYNAQAAALLGMHRTSEGQIPLRHAMELADRGRSSIDDERARFDWLQQFRPTYKMAVFAQLSHASSESFESWETYKALSVRNPNENGSTADTAPKIGKQEYLKRANSIVISYGVFQTQVVVWTYDGLQTNIFNLPRSASVIYEQTQIFVKACADKHSNPDDFAPLARVMYESLVAPIEAEVGNRSELIIETDTFLSLIPFEALLNAKGEYIGERFPVVYSPGLLYGQREGRDSTVNAKSTLLVVGAPVLGSGTDLSPLADTEDEAREISELFENYKIYMRQGGTAANIRKELPSSEVFHFTGHAVIRNGVTRLVLAHAQNVETGDAGETDPFDSNTLRKVRLIVLSACSTMSGSEFGLDDRDSMVRTLLAANVPHVVASRWIVDSAATRIWMLSFYRALLGGRTAPVAARMASETVRGKAGWNHSFYWAGFSVYGFGS